MKHLQKILLIVCISLISITSSGQNEATYIQKVNGEQVEVAVLNRHIEQLMDSLKMPGLSIAIINDSKLAYHQTFGVSNLETEKKITTTSIFEGASLSKPIFAYFVLKMVDKGIIDLDEPLHTYLEHPGIAENSIEKSKLITARMILSHSSGFPNFSRGQKVELPFTPGEGFVYSGEGYQYLAAIIGKLHNVGWKAKFNEIFEKEVTKPLGMQHTSFLWNAYLAENKVYGHFKGKPTKNDHGQWSGKTFNAFSSIHSEASEYAKFIIAMLKREGLSEASFDEMLQAHNHFSVDNELRKETGQTGWGLGFAQKPTPNGLMHLHTGNNHDFQAYTMFVPKQQYGLVIFTNSDKMLPFIQQLESILGAQF
ncbi:serine hydrolase domain-containing protein [Kordia sp.]|uniref:serine hydrolase domain-containing protein n=1 Tax=Kordia sp. TaxID=1965332 RepID=UPI0025BB32E2|nr:serine hydrolase domain-containing protein [Kordia sp.]MCH2192817.1 beta-lactamase family protein [Kordia sp.]